VVLRFKIAGLVADKELEMGLRLKTAERVDELIAMLQRHKRDVWPQAR
jgi:hypothetical protein